MRDWKNWLFPLLTCLIALGLALLPLRLSLREDSRLTGVVHCEELQEDSNFPAKVPDLPGRIRLLAQMRSVPDALTIMDQYLEAAALEEAAAQVRKELQRLSDAGILPEMLAESIDEFSGSRVYLRNQSDLSSASFLNMNAFNVDLGAYFQLVLDGETGQMLSLELNGWNMGKFSNANSLEIGRLFLDGLGLTYTEKTYEKGIISVFSLPEIQAQYFVQSFFYDGLFITPQVDWELLDQMAQDDNISIAASGGPVDSDR